MEKSNKFDKILEEDVRGSEDQSCSPVSDAASSLNILYFPPNLNSKIKVAVLGDKFSDCSVVLGPKIKNYEGLIHHEQSGIHG